MKTLLWVSSHLMGNNMKSLRSTLEDIQKENEHNTEYVESIEKEYREKYNIYYDVFIFITIFTAFFLNNLVEVIILITVWVISAMLYKLFIKNQISKVMDNDKAYYVGMHLIPETRSLNHVLNEYIRDNPDDYEQELFDRLKNDEPAVDVLNKMHNKIQSGETL